MRLHRLAFLLLSMAPAGLTVVLLETYRLRLEQRAYELEQDGVELEELLARQRALLWERLGPGLEEAIGKQVRDSTSELVKRIDGPLPETGD
jgi:hypothetical protein